MKGPCEYYWRFDSSFEELLWNGNSATSNQQNLQPLMTKIFKLKTGIASELTKDNFEFADAPYNM